MNTLPITLKLDARPCLIVGGGGIALQKAHVLVAAGARVRIVAPAICAGLRELAQIECVERAYTSEDLQGVLFVIAATDIAELNRAIYDDAHTCGLLVNVVDDPDYCDFLFPSILRRGDLTVAVSTAGASPALARRLREDLEPEFAPDLGELLARARQVRRTARRNLICAGARRAVNELAARAVVAARRNGCAAPLIELDQFLDELLKSQAAIPHRVRIRGEVVAHAG